MLKFSVVIQAGGKSSRMGEDKALMPIIGETSLIEFILDQIKDLGDERLIISNYVIKKYEFLGLPVYPDVFPNVGPLGGIYSAIYHSRYHYCLILACDMPFINLPLIDFMVAKAVDFDMVIPRWESEDYVEPFRAIYSKACLNPIREAIASGEKRVVSFFREVEIRFIDAAEISRFDPEGLTFFNVNTPEDFLEAQKIIKHLKKNH
jgi:molybdopterin-guanine dinucleotide biosynthesis protein A